MDDPSILYPVFTLIGWTFAMWFWMYATRIPAMQKLNVDVDELSRTGAPLVLPPDVARIADNYNHLHEQPTIFYALAICAALLGVVDTLAVGLAWGYVVLRIIHSLVQATKNVILVRFGVFAVGSLVLFGLFLRVVFSAL